MFHLNKQHLTHHDGRCGPCCTSWPSLPHGPACWSHLPWFGLGLTHAHSHTHAHALTLGRCLLLKACGCCCAGLSWSGCRCLGLLLELSPLALSPIGLGTGTPQSPWSLRPTSTALSSSRATARPGWAYMKVKKIVKTLWKGGVF